jgi:hypothetical protein
MVMEMRMNRDQMWRLFLRVLAAGLLCAAPARAQNAASSTGTSESTSNSPSYDSTREIKVEGAIVKIDTTSANAPLGTHILVQTAQGLVDAHLGFGPAAKPDYLGIAEGQSVTIVGMMEDVGGNSILLTRILTTPSRIFLLRNERGVAVRAIPRRSSSAMMTQKGGL